ncbi:hypothetical protein Tco_0686436 [Tanacetum coccineum]
MIGPPKPLITNTNVPQKYGSKKDCRPIGMGGFNGSHQKKGDEECVVEWDFSNCWLWGESSPLILTKIQSFLVARVSLNVTFVHLGDESVQGVGSKENKYNTYEKEEGEFNNSKDEEVAETDFMEKSSQSMEPLCTRG